jgi:hypothetical protein
MQIAALDKFKLLLVVILSGKISTSSSSPSLPPLSFLKLQYLELTLE